MMSYAFSEEWHDFMFQLMTAPIPDTHHLISYTQVLQADRMVWLKMAELCRGAIAMKLDGSYPLQIAMTKARLDPVIISTLQPLPKAGGFKPNATPDPFTGDAGAPRSRNAIRRTAKKERLKTKNNMERASPSWPCAL